MSLLVEVHLGKSASNGGEKNCPRGPLCSEKRASGFLFPSLSTGCSDILNFKGKFACSRTQTTIILVSFLGWKIGFLRLNFIHHLIKFEEKK